MKRSIALLTLISLTISSGCASLTSKSDGTTKKKDKSWFSFTKKEYQVPQSMNVTWAHDVYTIPGKTPTRGFGGRFYFYNEKSQAIPVDGELMVYGFDDTYGTAEYDNLNTATKRFKFTSEQLTNHFDEGQLGASYSVWIPWDAAPGDQKKIMLIPTFVAKDGRLVRGSAATLLLPGRTNSTPQQQSTTILQVSGSGNQNASTALATTPITGAQPHPQITTINMPRRGASTQPTSLTPDLIAQFEQIQQQHNRELEDRFKQLPPSMVNESTHITTPAPAIQPQLQTKPLIAPPPTNMNLVASPQQVTSHQGDLHNGWAMPQFAIPTLNQPQSHSQPNPPQAPASTFAPPVSYQQLSQQRP